MDVRENSLRAIRFERPEYIPVAFWINPACWHHYPEDWLVAQMASHRILFPDFDKEKSPAASAKTAPWESADAPYKDPWGCVWKTTDTGITGAVVKHPLSDWSALANLGRPDPDKTNGLGPIDWAQVQDHCKRSRTAGKLAVGSLEHGHTFLRLTYLRGYENLIFDMADDSPKLHQLIKMVEQFNLDVVRRYIEAGVKMMSYPKDLGMQTGLMLSPAHFRTFIKPVYNRLMSPAKNAGCQVHMHSDGDIKDVVDDLVDNGVDALNLQDLVNGLDWIAARLKGKICIDLDIDRQSVTRFGSPAEIDELVRKEVEMLGSPQGGLMMTYGLYPGVPMDNAAAVMGAMEKYSTCYS